MISRPVKAVLGVYTIVLLESLVVPKCTLETPVSVRGPSEALSFDKGEMVNEQLTVPEESNFYYLRKPIIIEPIGILK